MANSGLPVGASVARRPRPLAASAHAGQARGSSGSQGWLRSGDDRLTCAFRRRSRHQSFAAGHSTSIRLGRLAGLSVRYAYAEEGDAVNAPFQAGAASLKALRSLFEGGVQSERDAAGTRQLGQALAALTETPADGEAVLVGSGAGSTSARRRAARGCALPRRRDRSQGGAAGRGGAGAESAVAAWSASGDDLCETGFDCVTWRAARDKGSACSTSATKPRP